MGTVVYDSKKIIPAPLATITKSPQKTGNGDIVGKLYTITLTGKLVANKGSPTSSGTFWTTTGNPSDETVNDTSRLGSILRKQQSLIELFEIEGRSLEIQSLDGTQPLKCNPRILDINFADGIWYNTCDYTISFEADRIYPLDTNDELTFLRDFAESWSIDTDEQPENEVIPRIYRLTHNVSAIGKRYFTESGVIDKEAWQYARDYVVSKLGFDANVALSQGVNYLPSYYAGFNHTRSENRDEGAGSFSVIESWILASGSSLEDFTIETNKSNTSSIVAVNIAGTINGLEVRTGSGEMTLTTHKYTNALSRFAIASGLALSRAQTYSGYTLNVLPVSETVGRNPVAGTINYSFGFDTRPSTVVSGALSEVISISDNFDQQAIAIIGVLGRAAGPVLQNLGTKRELSRNLSVEVVMPRPTFGDNSLSALQSAFFAQRPTIFVSGIINAANPANQGYTQVYQVENGESWIPIEGRYSRNITWVFEA